MLQYIYTDEVTLTGANVMHVLYAAKKYILEGLEAKCTEFLDKKITLNNVCGLLTDSISYQDDKVTRDCLKMIARNIKALTKMEEFHCLSHDALLEVLKYDRLIYVVESDLFEGCLEWGKRQVQADGKVADDAEIRRVLGECLHQIRFPCISAQEFVDKFGKSSVLTGEEKSTILCLGLAKPPEHRTHLEWLDSHGFNTASRLMCAPRYIPVNVDDTLDVSTSKTEKFTFKVKEDVKLMGFSLFMGDKNSEYTVKISVGQLPEANASPKLCYEKTYKLRIPGNRRPNHLVLDKPFALLPNIGYSVTIIMRGGSPVKVGIYNIAHPLDHVDPADEAHEEGWDTFPTTDRSVSIWQSTRLNEPPAVWSFGPCGFVPEILLQKS